MRALQVPGKIRIRGQTWRINLVAPGELKDEDGDALHGRCDPDNRRIDIEQSDNPEIVEDTLVHELLHACFHTTGIVAARTEERLVLALTPPVLEVLRQLRWRD